MMRKPTASVLRMAMGAKLKNVIRFDAIASDPYAVRVSGPASIIQEVFDALPSPAMITIAALDHATCQIPRALEPHIEAWCEGAYPDLTLTQTIESLLNTIVGFA